MFHLKWKKEAPPRGESPRDRESIDHYLYLFNRRRNFVMPRKAVQ